MENKHSYHVALEWEKDRIGVLSSSDLKENITVATPPEFPGGVAGIWSPEHLFTSSVLSCFLTTFLAIAEFKKLEFLEFKCTAKGVLEKESGKYKMTKIILKPFIVLKDKEQKEEAIRLMERAEASCLISNSITTEVTLDFSKLKATQAV